jgi:hypothetical protein
MSMLKSKHARLIALASLLTPALCLSQAPPPAATPPPAPAQSDADVAAARTKAAQTEVDAADKRNTAAQAETQAAQKAADAAKQVSDVAGKLNDAFGAGTKTLDAATTKASAAAAQANDATTKANQATQNLNQALSQRPRPKASANKSTVDDFVPCMFDEDETYELRSRSNAELDQQGADAVSQSASNAAEAVGTSTSPASVDQSTLQKVIGNFKASVNSTLFLGVSPTQVPDIVREKAKEAVSNADIQDPKKAAAATAALDPVVQKATATATGAKFNRPDNVSCSFSLMDWHETSDVFGRRVANDYVALQVTVRNLDAANEFLIHDVQIAVDTGVSAAQFGRFQAGRDKLIVRAVAQRGQTEDRRNRVLNILEMMSNIAAGASGALTQGVGAADSFAGNFSTAVEIFQGPFINGFINIFPDHTIDHINHINDLTFSSSTTSKTIVPTNGAVPLVSFLREKPLEQLPFAHCGDYHWFFHLLGAGGVDPGDDTDPRSIMNSFCMLDDDDSMTTRKPPDPDPYAYWHPLHYSRWRPAALRILENRVYVVIAGVHIQELSSGPSVQSVKCPELADGSVNIAGVNGDGQIACTLTGSHLDKTKVAKAKLEKGTGAPIAATFTGADDGNSATMTIKPGDVATASGDFELYLTDPSGNDTDSKQKLTFGTRTVAFDATQPVTYGVLNTKVIANLTGTNLDLIGNVWLTDGTTKVLGTQSGTPPSPGTSPIGFSFTITASTFKAGAALYLTYTLKTDDASVTPKTIPNDPKTKAPQ